MITTPKIEMYGVPKDEAAVVERSGGEILDVRKTFMPRRMARLSLLSQEGVRGLLGEFSTGCHTSAGT